jgi:hypothetical protein
LEVGEFFSDFKVKVKVKVKEIKNGDFLFGAGYQIRTGDLLLGKQTLYQLS